ncbi:hypothetical protein AAFF_G00345340 [Aldrovandia affinis]|uniref:Uncharacterized protein n=1 Tax=Aldrovandia affinis TaxID=143900 RepID=A0AAD7R5M7_9TELE|nr:hypothetical protein AAFF_G00345340 [Aldrovandia affinis]
MLKSQLGEPIADLRWLQRADVTSHMSARALLNTAALADPGHPRQRHLGGRAKHMHSQEGTQEIALLRPPPPPPAGGFIEARVVTCTLSLFPRKAWLEVKFIDGDLEQEQKQNAASATPDRNLAQQALEQTGFRAALNNYEKTGWARPGGRQRPRWQGRVEVEGLKALGYHVGMACKMRRSPLPARCPRVKGVSIDRSGGVLRTRSAAFAFGDLQKRRVDVWANVEVSSGASRSPRDEPSVGRRESRRIEQM